MPDMEKETVESIAASPVPAKKGFGLMARQVPLEFYDALRKLVDGLGRDAKMTRLDWNNYDEYVFIKGEMLHIHRVVDGNPHTDHKWNIVLGDMIADDWIVY